MTVVERGHQDTLLDLLNSTPVVDGVVTDQLADPVAAAAWQQAHGGSGGAEELRQLLRARDALQDVVRGGRPAASLAPLLKGVVLGPRLSEEGVSWELEAPAERLLAAEAVLAWGALREAMPGRLRPCANPECRLYLLDRSKGNSGRW